MPSAAPNPDVVSFGVGVAMPGESANGVFFSVTAPRERAVEITSLTVGPYYDYLKVVAHPC